MVCKNNVKGYEFCNRTFLEEERQYDKWENWVYGRIIFINKSGG